jgi:hypothetical protein
LLREQKIATSGSLPPVTEITVSGEGVGAGGESTQIVLVIDFAAVPNCDVTLWEISKVRIHLPNEDVAVGEVLSAAVPGEPA